MQQLNPIGHKIIDILKEELDNPNLRIGFLPYKKEMWNSMKTVYQAAVEDGLECYVIPLLYFTRNSDMETLDKKHPRVELIDGIANTSYTKLKDLKLDVLFIHNPYDDTNAITYIHNDFHSSKLREISKLAYIPYHGDKSKIDTINQPGVANADFVFCIDEDDRSNFLKVFPYKKVYVVGSPKMEAVSQYVSGDKKRVTLLLSSLTPFLGCPERKMRQYKEVVDKEEIVIYRPHPLLDEMIDSMIPEYKEQYEKLKEYIRKRAIIDTTVDTEKVIAICDYMYADDSSIIPLWESTGKPYKILG